MMPFMTGNITTTVMHQKLLWILQLTSKYGAKEFEKFLERYVSTLLVDKIKMRKATLWWFKSSMMASPFVVEILNGRDELVI